MNKVTGLLLGSCLLTGSAGIAAAQETTATEGVKRLPRVRKTRQKRCLARQIRERVCAGNDACEVAGPLSGREFRHREATGFVPNRLRFVCGVGKGRPGSTKERYAF